MAYFQEECTTAELVDKIIEFIDRANIWNKEFQGEGFHVYSSKGESGEENLFVGIHDERKRPFPTTHMAMHVVPMEGYQQGSDSVYGNLLSPISRYDPSNNEFCGYNDWDNKVYFSTNTGHLTGYENVSLTVVVKKDYITAAWYPLQGTRDNCCNAFQYGVIDRINSEDKKARLFLKAQHYGSSGTQYYANSHGHAIMMNDWRNADESPSKFRILLGTNCPSYIDSGIGSSTMFGHDSGGDVASNLPLFDLVVPSQAVGGVNGIRGYAQGIKLPIRDVSDRFVSGDVIIDEEGCRYMYIKIVRSSYYNLLTYIGDNMFIKLE